MPEVLGYSYSITPDATQPKDAYMQATADIRRMRERKGAYSTFVTRGQRATGKDVLGYYGRQPDYVPPQATIRDQFDLPSVVTPGAYSGFVGQLASPGGRTSRYLGGDLVTTRGKEFMYGSDYSSYLENVRASQPEQLRGQDFEGQKFKRYEYSTGGRAVSYSTLATSEYSRYLDTIIDRYFETGYGDFRTQQTDRDYTYRQNYVPPASTGATPTASVVTETPDPEPNSVFENLGDKIADIFGW